MAETIQLTEALSYPVRDARWPAKAGILAVVSSIPILNFAGVGYEVETARRVAVGEAVPMPDWSDLGGHFRRGVWLALARIVYAAPLFVLMGLAGAAGFGFLSTLETEYEAWSYVLALMCAGSFIVMALYGLLFSLVSPAVTVRYLEVGTFASCFEWAAIWRTFRLHTRSHLLVFGSILLITWGLSLVVGPAVAILSLIPCLGTIAYLLVLAAVLSLVLLATAHLEGQLLRIVVAGPPV